MKKLLCAEVLLIVVLVGLHLFMFARGMGGNDGWSYLANTVSLVEDFDLDLSNNRVDLSRAADAPSAHPVPDPYMQSPADPTRTITHEPLGTSFFDFPFVCAATTLFGDKGVTLSIDHPDYANLTPRQTVQVLAVVVSHSFWTVMAMLLLYATLLSLDVPSGRAVAATLLVFFSSSLTWYGPSGLSHAVSTFTTALVLFAFVRLVLGTRKTPEYALLPGWFLLGALVGLAAVVRYANALTACAVGVYLLFERQTWARRLARGGAFAVGFLALWWINHLYWGVQFGTFLTPYGTSLLEAAACWLAPLRTLFSFKGGFFLFSPLFFFGVLALVAALRRRASAPVAFRASGFCLIAFLLLATLYGLHGEWWGGGFGNRFLTNCAVLAGVGVAMFLCASRGRAARWAVAACATAWSYLVFLLANARLAGDTVVSQNIGDYARLLVGREVPLGEIVRRIAHSSHTMSYLAAPGRRALLVAFILATAALLALAIVGMIRNARRDNGPPCPDGAD